MIRAIAVVCILSFLAGSPAWVLAQSAPPPATTGTPAGTPAIKPAVKKAPPKAKTAAKPTPKPIENGPCQLGVIPVIGDQFAVQKVGLTNFGNELKEVPIDGWALDDLVVARVRAAAPGNAVRRIAYPKGAFETYDHPAPSLFRNSDNDLTAVVRQITVNASCERYVVVTKLNGQLDGTNQTLRGIGVLNYGTSLFSHTSLFANIRIAVFDGQTFDIHKIRFDLGSILTGPFSRMTRDPLSELDNASFPEPAAEAVNSTILRDHTRALLAANLDKALPVYLKEE
jgi:hypothetical protein